MLNSVLSYLENTALKSPENIAVVDDKREITFRELKESALRIAGQIQKKFGCVKRPVLVYVPKSVESIICFMGVLYSGNFYTPTDVDFPFEKVNGVIQVLQPEFIICDEERRKKLIANGISEEQMLVISQNESEPSEYENFWEKIIDTDIVYTLFTSGSTGVPKGVSITNRSIIDYIDWAKECFDVDEAHRIGNQAPFYFDNSTLDIYLMLSTGATLYIIPKTCFSFPAKLLKYVVDNQINMVFWVPSVLINIANFDLLSKIDCSCLGKVLFAGEVMPNKQLNYWRKYLPDALYANLYGPTEITVDCTYYVVDREFSDDEPLPIGIPCRNSDVFILNDNDELITDENKIGELCVRGSSLAVGYWNNPEKTEEVFTQNPLNPYYQERIYRTGDLVYFNEKGEFVFSGRKDFQIKHLGYRIELGEIETAVLGCEGIENACALYDTDKKQIVLFYTGGIEKNIVNRYLLGVIPKYMIPSVYYCMEEFPYNDNGKIDRKALGKEKI